MQSHVELKKMGVQIAALEQTQRVMASIDNLRNFIRNFTTTLVGFRPLQQCVDTVVQLNTCGRCVAVRPPFCENVCAAIASACYSPFNDVLSVQLEQMWDSVRQIIEAAAEAIADLNANKGLFNVTDIVST